jgi:hypothetical protein
VTKETKIVRSKLLINTSLRPNFEYTKVDNAQKKRARCLHCDNYSYAQNSTREKEHLTTCLGLQASLKGPALKQQKLDDVLATRISGNRKAQIDQQLASCLFQTGKPPSMFNDDCWIEFFQDNFGYTPPHSRTISETLLPKVYDFAKAELKAELSASPFLGLIMDESTNINQNRIINTSVVTSSGDTFYWKNTEAEAGKLGAKELTAYIIETGHEITDRNMKKWTSFISDTCSTMRATWANIEQDPCSKHVITVPCDSHGLQLLIKDILQRPGIKKIWEVVANIVTRFKTASKQYAYLRVEQEKEYGKRKPMIVTCDTR